MIKIFFLHLISYLSSLYFSMRYIHLFSFSKNEYLRYLLKSSNLALCYIAFSKNSSLHEAIEAGRAGFLCCAYDVITDWKEFNKPYLVKYKKILSENVNEELRNIALLLYEKEQKGLLKDHGLERGEIAFRFITKMLGSFEYYKQNCEFEELGYLLQVGDDILDYEKDMKRNELNCLNSPQRQYYLKFFLSEFTPQKIERLFPSGLFFKFVIQKTISKTSSFIKDV